MLSSAVAQVVTDLCPGQDLAAQSRFMSTNEEQEAWLREVQ